MKSISEQSGYNRGFAEGYRAGLADGLAGKVPGLQAVLSEPVACLGISVRARNCLTAKGCVSVGDVAALSEDDIRYMRNLGPVTADEIAHALRRHNICHTNWDVFLRD